METLFSILMAIIALVVILFGGFWLGVGFIALINWIVFSIIDWFDKRRSGR